MVKIFLTQSIFSGGLYAGPRGQNKRIKIKTKIQAFKPFLFLPLVFLPKLHRNLGVDSRTISVSWLKIIPRWKYFNMENKVSFAEQFHFAIIFKKTILWTHPKMNFIEFTGLSQNIYLTTIDWFYMTFSKVYSHWRKVLVKCVSIKLFWITNFELLSAKVI